MGIIKYSIIKMFYLAEIKDHVRVEPKVFGLPTKEAIEKQLRETYNDYYDKDIGKVISIVEVLDVGEGIIIPDDGAPYYETIFKLLVWKPEPQEITYGVISEITNFGAFMDLGSIKGMIHISQTMDDYVSFTKTNTLSGKSTKRILKIGDLCFVRIVAISHKGGEVKIGLTMRQPGLGKIEWIKEEKIKKDKENLRALKGDSKEKNKKGKGGKK